MAVTQVPGRRPGVVAATECATKFANTVTYVSGSHLGPRTTSRGVGS